ncbi:MAG: ribosome maturation factor RimM [Alphaproteobacteria bacterium]
MAVDMVEGPDGEGDARVCVGVISGAHGLQGLVRVRPFTDVAEDVAAYGPVQTEDGTRSFTLDVRNRTGKGQILVHIEGVGDRDAAEALKGARLYVARDRLPSPDEDEFYHADLLGLDVVTVDGKPLGTVLALHDFGGGEMLEIKGAGGRLGTVSFTRAAVPDIDLVARRVTVDGAAVLWPGRAPEESAESGDSGPDGDADG